MDNENINILRKHYNNHIYPKLIEDIKKEFIEKNKVLYADPMSFVLILIVVE